MGVWANLVKNTVNYVRAHPVRSAILGTIAVVGVAALVTGIVFSGGALAAPIAAAGIATALGGTSAGVGATIAAIGAVALGGSVTYFLADANKKPTLPPSRDRHKNLIYDYPDQEGQANRKRRSTTASVYKEADAMPSPPSRVIVKAPERINTAKVEAPKAEVKPDPVVEWKPASPTRKR